MRLVIAQPHELICDALGRLLQAAGFEVAGRCACADELETCLGALMPELALVDADLACVGDVGALLRSASRAIPEGRVVMLAAGIESRLARQTLDLEVDVDKAGESWTHGDVDDGQDVYLRRTGDDTAWTDSNGNGLLTTLTQGDLPIQWSLRPSLAGPASFREAELTDDQLRAWNAAWQAYYRGTGPKPTMMLPPGTNSPTPDTTVIVNLPESKPAGPAPQAPVTNVSNVTSVNPGCVSNRVIKITFGKKIKKASVRVGDRVVRAHRNGGKLRARVSLKGMKGQPGDYVTTVIKTKKAHRKAAERVRMFKLC